MIVVWRATARDDQRRIIAWLAERNVRAASKLAKALVEATDGLARRPEKGRPGSVAGTRELSLVPPYVIIYQVDRQRDVVSIIRIWHSAQDRI